MAKWAFDDNVPRVRPRLRLGKGAEVETITDTPPVRAEERAPEGSPEAASDVAAEAAPVAIPAKAEPEVSEAPVAAVVAEPAPAVEPASQAAVRELVSPPKAVEPPPPPPPEPAPVIARRAPSKPAARAEVRTEDEVQDRRASLRRRAVVAGASVAPPKETPPAPLDQLDAIEAAADLAAELERALSQAAESNEQLRRDLGLALDDLSRATAENKRLQERSERLETDARDRSAVVQDLLQEMELLEGERDTALTQASEAALSTDALNEKLVLAERRVHDAERSLLDAQARSRRFEEQVQLHLAQRTALRAEVEGLRRERDTMVSRIAELEREQGELTRSRQALDEVHRALNEARQRAQRIRSR